jgi:GH35 family endo-1,4-beta-xylanase
MKIYYELVAVSLILISTGWAQPLCSNSGVTGECVLNNFNSTLTYDFAGFTQSASGGTLRVTDPANGWGGVGQIESFDLSNFADGRLYIDVTKNAGHQTDFFGIELIDGNDNRGTWQFAPGNLVAGTPTTMVANTNLSLPGFTFNNGPAPDLSNITTWQILGEFDSPAPFDLSFDRVRLVDDGAPNEIYAGQADNAAWRSVADSRIDQIRKADAQIIVQDLNGNRIPGATVNVDQTRHEFGFGSALVADRLFDSDPQHVQYKTKVNELFNIATLENALKWQPWDGDWGPFWGQAKAIGAVDYLNNQDIPVRGHAMVWPGVGNLPASVVAMLPPADSAGEQAIRDAISAHILDIGSEFSGDLLAWDVVNEPRTNHDIMDALPEGDGAMADWFQQARAADPTAKLFLNEFGILSSGGATNTSNQQLLINQIQALQAAGAPIDGVGLQSHFSPGNLTGPEEVWEILDDFQALGVDIHITEFDLNTTNSDLQVDFYEDFLTAAFAHEGVDEFLLWGFWEDAHWRPDAALFNSDWSIRPHGQAYLDKIFVEWWSNEVGLTDGAGESLFRAFKGDFDLMVSYLSESKSQSFSLSDGGETVTVTLDLRLGDFDADAGYDCADVDALVGAIAAGTNFEAFDLTGDGLVDGDDLTRWLELAGGAELASGNPFLVGDANLDGFVNGQDFIAWNNHKFTSGAGWCGGDFNGDGVTNGADFIQWNTFKFQSSDGIHAVPEPASWTLGFLGLTWLLCRRNGRGDSSAIPFC